MRHGGDFGAGHVELVDAPELLLFLAHDAQPFPFHLGDEQHVGAGAVDFEPIADLFRQHRRGEGAEAFAELIFRFILRCISGERASPRMLRAPSAAGRIPCDP